MTTNWYTALYTSLDKYLKLKIPFEAIHFPSTGLTSALVRYSHDHQHDENGKKIFIIDLRSGLFTNDLAANHKEFLHLIQSYLEQTLDISLDIESEKNIYRTIELAFKQYLDSGHEILIVFETTVSTKLQFVPDFRDMLVFLDKQRDQTNGKVNVMITSTYPIFNDENPAPIPMISRFVNFINPERIYETAYEDIFQKKIKPQTVKKIVEISGNLAYIIKSIERDLDFYHLKPEAILDRQLNQDFFSEFVNVKIGLDRIKAQFHPLVQTTLYKIASGIELETNEEMLKHTYLKEVGVLDDHNQIRGTILPAYCKLYCNHSGFVTQPRAEEAGYDKLPVQTGAAQSVNNDSSHYFNLNQDVKVDTVSGQVWVNGRNGNYLSEKELKVLALLYNNRGIEVSREKIAKNIWTGHEANSYSDWAMDKLISRIREKLGDQRPYHLIRTSRKIGFILN